MTNPSSDIANHVKICAQYKHALNILINIKEWESFIGVDKGMLALLFSLFTLLTGPFSILRPRDVSAKANSAVGTSIDYIEAISQTFGDLLAYGHHQKYGSSK